MEPPPAIKVWSPNPSLGKVQFGQSAFQNLRFGPKPHSKFSPLSTKRKLEATEIAEDDMACFKRVRLVTSKERVKFIAGPFHQVQLSDPDLSSNVAMRYKLEESEAWADFREKQKSLGSSHTATLMSLNVLIRILRNVGKSSTAEELLQATLEVEEATLVENSPDLLTTLLGSLMSVLVDQQKIDAAEALWVRASWLFLSNATEAEHDALLRTLELSYPFRRASSGSSPYSAAFGSQKSFLRSPHHTSSQQSAALEIPYEFSRKPRKQAPVKSTSSEAPVIYQLSTAKSDSAGIERQTGPMELAQSWKENVPPHEIFKWCIWEPEPEYTSNDKGPLISHVLPKMKYVPRYDQAHLDTFENESLVCARCPMRFETSRGLGRHVDIYHPLLYTSKLISHWTQGPFSSKDVRMHCPLVAWVCHSGRQLLLETSITWQCCGKTSSAFASFISLPDCSNYEHSGIDINYVLQQLISALRKVGAAVQILPRVPALEPERYAFGKRRLCELRYSPVPTIWSCVIVHQVNELQIF